MWNHIVCRTNHPYAPFTHFEVASSTWLLAQKLFPDALAATLMPNHLHLIVPASTANVTNEKMGALMGAVCKTVRITKLWQQLPSPNHIPDCHHLKRQIRYVALNPCRKHLVKDPLEWVWSTYRDCVGASKNSWVSSRRLVHAFREPERGFCVRFHSYVSGDPSTAVTGTPYPHAHRPGAFAEKSILTIL